MQRLQFGREVHVRIRTATDALQQKLLQFRLMDEISLAETELPGTRTDFGKYGVIIVVE